MSDEKRNAISLTDGLFTPDGLSYAEMAVKLHEHGYLTDEDMAEDGGVAALRRMLYTPFTKGFRTTQSTGSRFHNLHRKSKSG